MLGKALIRIRDDTIFSTCGAGVTRREAVLERRRREPFSIFLTDELADIPA